MGNLNLAPIVLFVYNRPEHTKKTIACLKKNYLANSSELFIYSDAEKNREDKINIKKVRKILDTITGFKKIKIIKRNKNYGLANNIISGINDIFKKYDKAIILEDDVETGKFFLKFLNASLKNYKKNPKIWHISGWNYPIDLNEKKKIKDEIFFWKVMNCWGWGTWRDRWKKYRKDPSKLINNWDSQKIKNFNLDGHYDFWKQVENNYNKITDTWAIFWMATIFEHNGYCLNPLNSYVFNSGNDNSGENTKSNINYKSKINDKMIKKWSNLNDDFDYIIETIIKNNFKKKNFLINFKDRLSRYL